MISWPGDVGRPLAQVDRQHPHQPLAPPEGVNARRQGGHVAAVLEDQADPAGGHGRGLEQLAGAVGGQDHGQIRMLEAHRPRVDHLGAHLVEGRPQGVQPRAAHRLDPAVHPDDGPLMVLEVEHQGLAGQGARTDDHLQVAVGEDGVAHRNPFQRATAGEIEHEVAARRQQPLEDAAVEQEAPLVLADMNPTHRKQHFTPPWRKNGLRKAERRLRHTSGAEPA
jgi:hypothetical protein